MKLDTLLCSCNSSDLNPKPSKKLAGRLPGGCYRGRRKVGMTTNRGGVVAVPRGWFGVVRKKLHVKTKLTPHHNKNIIIIHNNTSITSNEEDNRASSCVEPGKDQNQIATKNKDQDLNDLKRKRPGDGVVEEKSSTVKNEGVEGESDGVKDQKETPNVGVARVEAIVVVDGETKTKIEEELKQKEKSDDGDVNVEHKLTLDNVDAEAATQGEEEHVGPSDEEKSTAAIRIQTAFRSHLAKRAFRALRSLVRLQAVVRGVVVRRQARMALHCMRALVRLGDRVRSRQLLSRSTDG